METIQEAIRLMENKQGEDALHLLEAHLPTVDDDKKYMIAELYYQWGFLQESKVILEELLDYYPEESDLSVLLTEIYIELEEDKNAMQLLDNVEDEDPNYIQSLLQLADLYQAQGLFEVAEQKLLTAKNHDPNEPIIDFALAEFLFSIGEYERSIIYYEKLIPETMNLIDVSIPIRLAEAHAASGEYEKALNLFQQSESDDPDILFKHGLTAYHANRKDIAIHAWEKVIEDDPEYYSVYYELSKAYQEEGLLNEAYDTIHKGLKIDEFNKENYFLAGVLAHQLDDQVESEKLVRQAIVLDPDYKQAVLFLIEFLKNQDSYKEVVALMQELKEQGAYDPLYEWELAKAYNELELFDHALKHYNEAYNNLNEDSEFLKDYGYFLTEDGKMHQAIPVFQLYLEYETSDVDTQEYLARLIQNDENI